MPTYRYTAIDSSGQQKTGKIDAKTPDEATKKLADQNLTVSAIVDEGAAKAAGKKKFKMPGIGKVVNTEGLALFTRQLSTLLQAGLPLLRSLEVMIRQEKNERFKEVVAGLAEAVRSGNNFSDGLQRYPKVFDRLFVNMVKAGEAGGVLDVVLSRVARFMEKSVKTTKKVKSAMVYPAVVITVAIIIVCLLLVFVVPSFEKIFKDMLGGAKMPTLTLYVINASRFVAGHYLTTAGAGIGVFFGIKFILKTTVGKKVFDRALLATPKIGDFARKANISRFTRTFGTLMSSGVPILQALTITRDIIDNTAVAAALTRVHDRVRDGEPLATPLEQQKIFPTMVSSMIEVGEETGELPEMLNRIADNYDEDIDNTVASLTSIMEPIMIVFLAVVVGTIVVALFLPIIKIIENLSSGK